MGHKSTIQVTFSKHIPRPDMGGEAYEAVSHDVTIPYGKGKEFKTGKNALEFVYARLDESALQRFDAVEVVNWYSNYGGTLVRLKASDTKGDGNPLDVAFCETLLTP